jgi:hypothetical protein
VSGLDNNADGGAGGIRTLDRALQPYNGLANRRLQPLGHSSVRADMPDAGASRKRQISARGFPSDLTPDPSASNAFEADAGTPGRWAGKRRRPWNCYVCVVNAAGIGQCRSGFFVHAG